MNNAKYNGWTNYETWNVALWLGNDEGTSSYWNERASEIYRDAKACKTFTRLENATCDLAECLKEEFDTNMEDNGVEVSGFYEDLLNAALREVNWHEIARHYVEEVSEEIDKEEEEESSSHVCDDHCRSNGCKNKGGTND